jgi:hypothetical protein
MDPHGKPKSLYVQFQEQRMTVVALRKRNQADGVETAEERAAELAEQRRLEVLGAKLAVTDEAIASALCGSDGIRSRNFLQVIAEQLPNKVTRFREREKPAWPLEAA